MPPKRRSSRLMVSTEDAASKKPRLSLPTGAKYDFETDGKFLQDAQLHLLNSGYLSDLTLTCKGRTWKVHKAILGQTCAFFRAICGGNFKESDTVTLEEDEPVGIDAMLRYLYARVKPNVKTTMLEDMVVQLVTADKYYLGNLAQSIKKVIRERIELMLSQVAYTEKTRRNLQCLIGSVFAEEGGNVWEDLKHRVAQLVLDIMKKQKENRAEIEGMIEDTPSLRKLVLDEALKDMDEQGANVQEDKYRGL